MASKTVHGMTELRTTVQELDEQGQVVTEVSKAGVPVGDFRITYRDRLPTDPK